jgi:quinol monooxygenase YgiN
VGDELDLDVPQDGLTIFARFHAREGCEAQLAAAIAAVVPPTRAEPDCHGIEAYCSVREPRLFFIHSRWRDEAAFDAHAGLPHTVRFLETVQPLIDHPLDVNRTRRL